MSIEVTIPYLNTWHGRIQVAKDGIPLRIDCPGRGNLPVTLSPTEYFVLCLSELLNLR